MIVFFFDFWAWIRCLQHIFALSQNEPCNGVRTRWLTAANFDFDLTARNHVDSLLLRSTSPPPPPPLQLWALYEKHSPNDYFSREGNINSRQNSKFLRTQLSIGRSALPCLYSSAPRQSDPAGSAATFLATESTGTVLTCRQMSQVAGHCDYTLVSCLKVVRKFLMLPS